MVQRSIKIPKHGGPDGEGMNDTIFENLLQLLATEQVTDEEAKKSIELCLTISRQDEWNSVYRPMLIEKIQ